MFGLVSKKKYNKIKAELAFERRANSTKAMVKTEMELFLRAENEELKNQVEELKAKYCDELQKRLTLTEQVERFEKGGAEDDKTER